VMLAPGTFSHLLVTDGYSLPLTPCADAGVTNAVSCLSKSEIGTWLHHHHLSTATMFDYVPLCSTVLYSVLLVSLIVQVAPPPFVNSTRSPTIVCEQHTQPHQHL
jgi:hypothetical protein